MNWLESNNRRREIENLLMAINYYITMKKTEVSWSDMIAAIDYMKKYILDFVDALTLQTMKKNNINEIYTNDKDFDCVKWVRRVWK
ncbi:MAG TPA: PIN domain-containing protein [Candidatus Bathyarchaeota archaeon]|nr:PIN domain-containing protein [Candidatus Bathyarchaeota archaeon]